jgi:hypothetical protein
MHNLTEYDTGKNIQNFPQKLKRGQVREDGRVFAQYCKGGYEYWVTQQQWKQMVIRYRKNSKNYYKNNPKVREKKIAYAKTDLARSKRLKRVFGISLEDYNKKLLEQNGVCSICKTICKSGKDLAVDHCHTSGKVRGLLCSNCNTGVGVFQENKELLFEAVRYLQEWGA